ncbi:glutamine synthetase [Mycobacterium shinjukuense]|uniref:Glutamine synthetase GlnA n=1 Tax=Mycobacterium shinjukuense TaxID=398694 RepID=A0A7I7MPG7_9MYCO|nr:glutamine synthetase family protein [Mycobacterium shinjukuense]MCV6984695.1 glutamine synthetase [Mycobacterium shinjukuense]ORB67421.1 glutamine synthetase [Mycobacterium shinjukuense]BBX73413.1 glutamine synthetase GlnA [Mycobacterium shinjukuense]
MTATPLAAAAIAQLEAEGVDTVMGTVVNPAGITLAKMVPIRRTNTFADPGLGASPVWHVLAIDQNGIAFTEDAGVVGDQRVRIDLSALRIIGDGLAWAPAVFVEQDGTPVPACSRGTLCRIEAALAAADIEAVVGHEVEFMLVDADGARLPSTLWAPYGLAGLLEHEAFVRDVISTATAAGVAIEQFHPEYGANQFEISLAPLAPVAAADQLVATRIIIGRAARRHGMRVSLSPAPFAGNVGSGAHQHLSLITPEGPLFSDETGGCGMTAAGRSAVAGILRRLPEAQGILCGSIVSGLRMRPGNWAGAYVCWGTENREAAVRFIKAGPGGPHGGNVEVKVVDPSANPYFASAALLGLALDGISDQAALPPETTVDPAMLSDADRARAGTVLLPQAQAEAIAALDNSKVLREILGDPAVDMVVAVRRMEQDRYANLGPEQLADKFRMAWSL